MFNTFWPKSEDFKKKKLAAIVRFIFVSPQNIITCYVWS